MIDTFSANSLKILDKSKEDFEKKYIQNIDLISINEEIEEGNKFHALICYYLKGYDIEKFEAALFDDEKKIWEKTKKAPLIEFALQNKRLAEQPFYIKDKADGKEFYLTGRFDLVILQNDSCTILDWKTKNLPKDPNNDIQSLVYLYSAQKLFNTNNVKIIYYSLIDGTTVEAFLKDDPQKRIKAIIKKLNG